MSERNQEAHPLLVNPVFGSAMTVLSGLSFLLVCMMLPLVGPSGSTAMYPQRNFLTFLGVLLIALVLSVLAIVSKLERRKVDQSPWPLLSVVLCALCCLLMVALLTGLLRI